MPAKQSNAFVVTNWNLETDYEALVAPGGQFRFIAAGRETCPSTGRDHDQAFVYFWNRKSTGTRTLNAIGNMFGSIHCRAKPMLGNFQQNTAYCSKESSLRKFGEEPKQGERGDIKETAASIMSGQLTSDEVCVADPEFHHKYGRTLDRLETIAMRKRFRTQMTKGIWYTGPTGAGKSHKVFEGYDPETHYVKNINEDWWDGYKQQPIVVINEFRGQIPLSELLDLVDKWPKTVKWRNRETVPFTSTQVLIASIFPPEEVYKRSVNKGEAWEQFLRRFEIVTLAPRPQAPAPAPAAPLEESSQETVPDWAQPLAWDDGSDWGRSPGGD